ncbi:Endocuticle structural glycoprotein SgAbd-2, partial [Gryllus bimaculatus]
LSLQSCSEVALAAALARAAVVAAERCLCAQTSAVALLLAAAALMAPAAAAPRPQGAQPTPIPILRSVADTNHDGNYVYSYETGNSIAAQEESKVLDAGTANERRRVEGRYSYVDNEGNPFEGAHLPREPELPEWLRQALARNAAEEAKLSPQQLAEVETGRYVIR